MRIRHLLAEAENLVVKAWHENLSAAPGSWSLARTAEKLHLAGLCDVLPVAFKKRMKATNEHHIINRRAGMGQVSFWEQPLSTWRTGHVHATQHGTLVFLDMRSLCCTGTQQPSASSIRCPSRLACW